MFDINKLKTDPTLENEGVWVKCGGELQLKVAAWGNRKSAQKFSQLLGRNPSLKRAIALQEKNHIEFNDEDQSKFEDILVEVMASSILFDWKGITEGGVAVEYSPEKAREFLRIKAFRDMVKLYSEDESLFQQQQIKEDLDTLKKSSSGS